MLAVGAASIIVNGKGIGPLWLAGLALLAAGLLMRQAMTRAQRPPSGEAPPLALDIPVNGRWTARNGPATMVPSHTHNLAQTYAIDLARRPAPEPVWLWPARLRLWCGRTAPRLPAGSRSRRRHPCACRSGIPSPRYLPTL